jgi:hypothetical protein
VRLVPRENSHPAGNKHTSAHGGGSTPSKETLSELVNRKTDSDRTGPKTPPRKPKFSERTSPFSLGLAPSHAVDETYRRQQRALRFGLLKRPVREPVHPSPRLPASARLPPSARLFARPMRKPMVFRSVITHTAALIMVLHWLLSTTRNTTRRSTTRRRSDIKRGTHLTDWCEKMDMSSCRWQ